MPTKKHPPMQRLLLRYLTDRPHTAGELVDLLGGHPDYITRSLRSLIQSGRVMRVSIEPTTYALVPTTSAVSPEEAK